MKQPPAEDAKDLWKPSGPSPLFKQGFLKTVLQDGFWKSVRRKMPQPPWATCAPAQSHSQWKSVLWCSGRAFCISVCALCLWLCHGAALKRPQLSFLYHPFRYLEIFLRPPETSTRLTVPALSALPQRRGAASCHLSGLLLDSHQYPHVLPVLGHLKLGRVLWVRPHQYWGKGKNHISWPTDNIPPNAAQNTISLLCCQGILQESEVLFCKVAVKVAGTQETPGHGVVAWQGLLLPLFELHEIPDSPAQSFDKPTTPYFLCLQQTCPTIQVISC